MITRDLRPNVSDKTQLKTGDLEMVEPTPQDLPRRDRAVTYPTPEGPSRLGTRPVAPYGEDPHDPTTHAEPRVQATGMVGRLHE